MESEPLRLRQRWMSWPWGVFGLVIAGIMAGVGVYSLIQYPEEKPSVRVAIPMFALALYWVFALLCNQRTAAVGASLGVRVVVWPLFVRPPHRVKRSDIRHCYVREVEIHDEGTLLERHYEAGVERRNGEHVCILERCTAEEAERVAGQVAAVLNEAVGYAPVAVQEVGKTARSIWGILALTGVWLALFLGAIFVGVAWETAPR